MFPSLSLDRAIPHRRSSCFTFCFKSLWTNTIGFMHIKRNLYSIERFAFSRLEFVLNTWSRYPIDLAIEQGQDERIIPFEEYNQFSNVRTGDLLGSLSTQPVIDIRELQFECCVYTNHRKEVWQGIFNDIPIVAKIFKLRHQTYTPTLFQHEIDKIK